MGRKQTPKRSAKFLRYLRPEVVGVLVVAGLFGLSSQLRADLAVHKQLLAHGGPMMLGTPIPKPTPSVTPPPTAAPTPPPAKPAPRATHQPPATQKYVAPVAPAPDSSVSNLVAVSQPGSTPTATPTPGSGAGSSPGPSPSGSAAQSYSYTSSNWSGYLAAGGHFTSVSGSWVVPNVSGNGTSTTADAAWVGIGGVTSGDLIQAGTNDTVTKNGTVIIQAFYEMLPAPETPISMTVNPGDRMTVSVAETSAGQWHITISDITRSENFSINVSYASSHSTAEWIEEDPSFASGHLVPFDTFGSVNFSGGVTTEDGADQSIASAGGESIVMVNHSGHQIAIPSALTHDGQGFTVTGN